MVLSRLNPIVKQRVLRNHQNLVSLGPIRTRVYSKTGGLLPEPHRTSFGIIRLILTVVPGLLIGAAISKSIANFLEENDLFVPSDDDDDDD
ncbi:essential MCU regulator, mitochondrial [Tribolium madens]|uniref:essential MCU regulator, mitochondrial n=1 Tax=Tribolium madens TaxID=41895 RepID=UPI001CF73053|nr:essential MCU regulator, mitochondrial [Tribolium madens]